MLTLPRTAVFVDAIVPGIESRLDAVSTAIDSMPLGQCRVYGGQ